MQEPPFFLTFKTKSSRASIDYLFWKQTKLFTIVFYHKALRTSTSEFSLKKILTPPLVGLSICTSRNLFYSPRAGKIFEAVLTKIHTLSQVSPVSDYQLIPIIRSLHRGQFSRSRVLRVKKKHRVIPSKFCKSMQTYSSLMLCENNFCTPIQ